MLRPFIAVARPVNIRVLAAVLSVSVVVAACADAPTQPARIVAQGPSRTIATGAVLTVTPTSFDYGSVIVGATSDPETFTVANTGTDLLYLTDIALSGPNAGDFQVGNRPDPGCSFGGEWGWPAGMPCYIGLRFVPSGTGSRTATLTIKSVVGTIAVSLSGTGLPMPATADLSVSMAGAMQGKSITYTIALKNGGPNDATGVEVGDMLPSGTTFASISAPSDFTCLTPIAGSAGPVKCTAMSLANGASRTIQLVVKLAGSTKGSVSNTAAALSSVSDPQTNNNSATVTINVGKR
jgi:uncharacterized repeat protein (TIGR01451 family)